MKKRKLIPALALTLALLCGITIGATASNGIQKIQVDLDPTISVKYNGETQTMLDANGSRIYPIAYNGTTYLPIRTVAGLAGVEAKWDQATRSVLLGKQSGGVDLIDTIKYYHVSDTRWSEQVQSADKKDAQDISGFNVSHWIGVPLGTWRNKGDTNEMHFNLQGKYSTISFKYYCAKDAILRILGDNGSELGEYTIKGGQVAQQVSNLPLLSTSELTFQVEVMADGLDSATIYIFDTVLN